MVSKKQRRKNIIIGIVLVGLFLLIISQQEIFPFAITSVCSGGHVLSINDISTTGQSPLNKPNVIRILMSTNPRGECLNIRVTQADIESAIPGFQADGDIIGDIELTKSENLYNINPVSSQNYLGFGVENIGDTLTCTQNRCRSEPSLPDSDIFASFRVQSGFFPDCYCFSYVDIVQGGEIQSRHN